MTPPADVFSQPEVALQPSSLVFIWGAVALTWMLIAGMLVAISRTRHVRSPLRCPMLRREVIVDSHEWKGRMLDVRSCSGLRPPDDFGLCRKNCLER